MKPIEDFFHFFKVILMGILNWLERILQEANAYEIRNELFVGTICNCESFQFLLFFHL